MDIRLGLHTNIEEHCSTLHRLAALETPAKLVWDEVSAYLERAAVFFETYELGRIEVKTPHVDLTGTMLAPRIAEFVGSTSEPDEPNMNLFADRNGGSVFLPGSKLP